jgi:hypothetical protein
MARRLTSGFPVTVAGPCRIRTGFLQESVAGRDRVDHRPRPAVNTRTPPTSGFPMLDSGRKAKMQIASAERATRPSAANGYVPWLFRVPFRL